METIESLTKEINRLADSYYLKSSQDAKNDCIIRMNELEDRRRTLKKEERND